MTGASKRHLYWVLTVLGGEEFDCVLCAIPLIPANPRPLIQRPLSPQFTPAIRPFLQTISIGLVSFGEHYKRNETGLSESLQGLACSLPSPADPPPHHCPSSPTCQGLPDTPPDPQV